MEKMGESLTNGRKIAIFNWCSESTPGIFAGLFFLGRVEGKLLFEERA